MAYYIGDLVVERDGVEVARGRLSVSTDCSTNPPRVTVEDERGRVLLRAVGTVRVEGRMEKIVIGSF